MRKEKEGVSTSSSFPFFEDLTLFLVAASHIDGPFGGWLLVIALSLSQLPNYF